MPSIARPILPIRVQALRPAVLAKAPIGDGACRPSSLPHKRCRLVQQDRHGCMRPSWLARPVNRGFSPSRRVDRTPPGLEASAVVAFLPGSRESRSRTGFYVTLRTPRSYTYGGDHPCLQACSSLALDVMAWHRFARPPVQSASGKAKWKLPEPHLDGSPRLRGCTLRGRRRVVPLHVSLGVCRLEARNACKPVRVRRFQKSALITDRSIDNAIGFSSTMFIRGWALQTADRMGSKVERASGARCPEHLMLPGMLSGCGTELSPASRPCDMCLSPAGDKSAEDEMRWAVTVDTSN
jgi:hypothetical protein